MATIDDWDTRPEVVNGKDIPTFVRFNTWMAGLMTIVVGLVYVGSQLNTLSVCTAPNSCIGPNLFAGTGGVDLSRNLNIAWRTVFSLQPSVLVETWTPVFVGIISWTSHLPGFHYRFLTRSWVHRAGWDIFLAIFGHLGYAGNLGVIFGTYAIVCGFMSLMMQFTKWRNERPTLHVTLGGVLDRYSFMVNNEVMIEISKALSLALGLLSIVNGFIFVLTQNFNWCPVAGEWDECFGPSVRWNSGGAHPFVFDSNGPPASGTLPGTNPPGWRSVFTFDPEIFFPMWGPVLLGYITIIQHLDGRTWPIHSTWPRVCLWFMFLGLFGNMGYTGTLGIIVGFLCVLESLLAFLISIGGGTNIRCHYQIKIHFNKGGDS